MSNLAARTYTVGILTGSGIGLLVGWVLNSAYWYNGSTAGTPVVGGITAILCGAGAVIYSLRRRGEGPNVGGAARDV